MGKTVTGTKAPITLSAFAKRIGVARPQISKAVASGRLNESVGRGEHGQPVILDAQLAEREWVENAKRSRNGAPKKSLAEAQRRLTLRKDRAQKIANDVKLGRLVDVAVYERISFEAARTIREGVMNVPDRIAAELAAETNEGKVHARLEAELRLALEAASTKLRGKKAS
jgi:hypothetical protein